MRVLKFGDSSVAMFKRIGRVVVEAELAVARGLVPGWRREDLA